jgi:3-oxoadipate enol-lactonase
VTDAFVTVDGARLRCRFEGTASSPVVMLSNSLGADLTMWDDQLPTLLRQFRVLRYDTRGHGGSTVAPGPCSIERLGRDVVGVLDGLGIDRVHFCGLSLGGMTGMWLGLNAPNRLRRLVLANTAARIVPPENWNARIERVRTGGMRAIAPAVLERWFTPAFHAQHPERIAAMQRMLEGTPADGYVAACSAVRDMDQREAIAGIRVPTLVIAGASDQATPPADGRHLARRIAGARYVELATAHISNIEAAAEFNAAVVAFLND